MTNKIVFVLLMNIFGSLAFAQKSEVGKPIQTGSEQTNLYLPLLINKRVGLLVNQTSVVGNIHLLDLLRTKQINVTKIFAPEHGFRGNYANGETVDSDVDRQTGLPIISLYGKNKQPTVDQMANLDVVVFDIQDVGTRFFTYISTMHYMMEVCADLGIKFVVLDRPNPNGHIVDGPVLNSSFASFVGMHPIPILHGLTVGELAKMIVGEGWLQSTTKLDLVVIPVTNWTHHSNYSLPIAPSPNLPNAQSVALYPSLCLFEGTTISVGRGTSFPFQVIGYPDNKFGTFTFTPVNIAGKAVKTLYENQVCFGIDLRKIEKPTQLDLHYIIDYYHKWIVEGDFFTPFFDKLAGTDQLKIQIKNDWSEEKIRDSWSTDLKQYLLKRNQYLIYPD